MCFSVCNVTFVSYQVRVLCLFGPSLIAGGGGHKKRYVLLFACLGCLFLFIVSGGRLQKQKSLTKKLFAAKVWKG